MSKSFRTELNLPPSLWKIDHDQQIITLGSCFSDDIGTILKQHKFQVEVNPFGTVYDPLSIARLLKYSLNNTLPLSGLVEHQGIYSHLDFHSNFNATSPGEVESCVKETVTKVHKLISETEVLVITLGTAWVFHHTNTDSYVANCHKLPSSEFTRRLLNPKEVIRPLRDVVNELKGQYPDMKIILTVSPVRHIKDGLEDNQVSKSLLRIACHYLSEDIDGVDYFPSYELVLDDLRDYRYYKEDLIHPTEMALKYIWDGFSETYFSEKTKSLNRDIDEIINALNHCPFHPESEGHQRFLRNVLTKVKKLNEHLNFEEELEVLKGQLV